jgi:tetratricopeptide (TPR) repeat protein
MNQSRLEQLLAFLKEDPHDPFNLYAVATEYVKTNPLEALNYYEKLLNEHDMYVPTYYHAAKLYVQLGRKQEAKNTFQKGILISLQQGNRNAHRELQNAYNEFLDDEEE